MDTMDPDSGDNSSATKAASWNSGRHVSSVVVDETSYDSRVGLRYGTGGEGGGEWPAGQPLPLPQWLPEARPALRVDSVLHYEELAAHVELAVQQVVHAHHYNAVGNFIRFYDAFASRRGKVSVAECLEDYVPPISQEHHTCVGLALTLMSKLHRGELSAKYPGLREGLFIASSEEAVDDPEAYVQRGPAEQAVEKEHVVVALRIDVNGRQGVLLLDPGYNIARVITVMADGKYPHTGWFTQTNDELVKREYRYTWTGDQSYVRWTSRETRVSRETPTQTVSEHLVYVDRPYVSPIDVTERRNLVYDCRSLLARDTKGQLVAGIYFRIGAITPPHQPAQQQQKPPQANLFYTDHATNTAVRVKIPFHLFLHFEPALSSKQLEVLVMCNNQLGLPENGLRKIMTKLAFIMLDNEFIEAVLQINHDITDQQ